MVRAGDRWAAAARRRDGGIAVHQDTVPPWTATARGIPVVRGVLALGTRPLGSVDYTLAKRALLREFRTGLLSRLEVCDAHPELLRAARYLGTRASRPCPMCEKEELRLLAYVYGEGMARDNGRAFDLQEGLTVAVERKGICYVVEVCTGCSWNHLSEAFQARTAG